MLTSNDKFDEWINHRLLTDGCDDECWIGEPETYYALMLFSEDDIMQAVKDGFEEISCYPGAIISEVGGFVDVASFNDAKKMMGQWNEIKKGANNESDSTT